MQATKDTFYTRSGAYVGNVGDELSKRAQAIPVPQRNVSPNLQALEDSLASLVNRVSDRRDVLNRLRPHVQRLESVVDALRGECAEIEDQYPQRKDGKFRRPELVHVEKKLARAEHDLKNERERVEITEKIIAATERLIERWHRANDATIQQLRSSRSERNRRRDF